MKRMVRTALGTAGRAAPVYALYRMLNLAGRCLAEPLHQAERVRRAEVDAALARRISPSLVVRNGPFAGLRYPSARAAGSALVPKLVGSYERELHPVIERLLGHAYSDVVDIGAAEGYYAVGLARRLPAARVHAYDTDRHARELCRAMAELNGVDGRVRIEGHCDARTLVALPLGARALVVSDCEGYEAELFTDRVADRLAAHDVLIEVHDQHDADLGQRLRDRFAATHDVLAVDSIDDARKPRSYVFPELASFGTAERRRVLGEGRTIAMEWLVFTSRRAARPARRAVPASVAA